ncbi:ankyrin-3-like [Trichogramma pretiosum]|uniref:ankyrin-3-like n=1 Tax=Trichogramma pretiosum TaxID=7493 RepID=UPI0006C9508F|nr:ankyrin-3-like [Trichogramma pretiosum]
MNIYNNVDNHLNKQNLDRLRDMREKFNYEIEEDQHEFLGQLYCLFNDWEGQYPDFQDIFEPEEVDWLLAKSISFRDEEGHNRPGELFIKFVANSGYKYQPKIEQDGKPLERRTTAVHHAARSGFLNKDIMVRELFKIYNDFDVNYTDSSGLTHFHVACAIGCDYVVKKFLELGQDPNLLVHETGYSALHLALEKGHKEVVRSLLRNNADPNLTNPEGSTALHLICKMDRPKALMRLLFEISDEKSQPLPLDARDKEGKTALHLALEKGHRKVVQLLLERDADPNLAHPEGSTALHLICKMNRPIALMKLLFEISDKKNQPLPLDAQDKKGKTALHWALKDNIRTDVAEWLLRKGADSNLADKEGSTALHIICKMIGFNYLANLLFQISDEKHRHVLVDAQDNEGNTPLHLALCHVNEEVARLLLRRGANPTLANKDGNIPLHMGIWYYDVESLRMLFELSNAKYHSGQLNAKDKQGMTPLHLALKLKKKLVSEFLLRQGADPHLTDDVGNTALHVMSFETHNKDLVEMFFKVNDELNQQLQIDARDSYGTTPLSLALLWSNKKMIEQLMRRGADPNLAKVDDESTPLHFICSMSSEKYLAGVVLKIINEDSHQTVSINMRDRTGQTPLEWVVARLSPNTVDVLLDHGADLSNFVFPSERRFNLGVESNDGINIKVTSGILAVVERLETRGYELSRTDALTIMNLFAKHKLFVKSADLEVLNWQDHEEVTIFAKETMISPSLSLYDLLQLRPKEVAKRFTCKEFFEFARSKKKLSTLRKKGFEACVVAHLCEKLSRRFFQSWTLYPFWDLIHKRLPLECCDMVLDNLTNEDLYHIFLTAGEQSS